MQITFRSTEKENKVRLWKIVPYYNASENPSDAKIQPAAKENKDKLFIYGD